MSSETDRNQRQHPAAEEQASDGVVSDVLLKAAQVQAMRRLLHELANIFTGIMLAGGLLAQCLEQTSLGPSASGLYGNCERGRRLVWELRGQLLAGGEPSTAVCEAGGTAVGSAGIAVRGDEEQRKSSTAAAEGGCDD